MLFRPVFRPCFGLKYGSFLKPEMTPNASKMRSKIVPRKRSVQNLIWGRFLSHFEPLQSSKMSFSPRRRAHFRCVTCSPFSSLQSPVMPKSNPKCIPKSAKMPPKRHPRNMCLFALFVLFFRHRGCRDHSFRRHRCHHRRGAPSQPPGCRKKSQVAFFSAGGSVGRFKFKALSDLAEVKWYSSTLPEVLANKTFGSPSYLLFCEAPLKIKDKQH